MKNKNQKGFTVLEMMIVLAVCGMILSVVLMALPSLQRNSRNNSRKNDVSAVLQAVSRYQTRNSGDFPSHCTNGTCRNEFLASTKLYYYVDQDITVTPSEPLPTTNPEAEDDKVKVLNRHRCAGAKATSRAAGYFDIVALYKIEVGGGSTAAQCQQL